MEKMGGENLTHPLHPGVDERPGARRRPPVVRARLQGDVRRASSGFLPGGTQRINLRVRPACPRVEALSDADDDGTFVLLLVSFAFASVSSPSPPDNHAAHGRVGLRSPEPLPGQLEGAAHVGAVCGGDGCGCGGRRGGGGRGRRRSDDDDDRTMMTMTLMPLPSSPPFPFGISCGIRSDELERGARRELSGPRRERESPRRRGRYGDAMVEHHGLEENACGLA